MRTRGSKLATLSAMVTTAGLIGIADASQMQKTSHQPPPKTPVANTITTGLSLFTQRCIVCHGPGGIGGEGPDLRSIDLSSDAIGSTISHGVPGEMPAFGPKLTGTQVADIADYVKSLAAKPPGSKG